MLPLVVVGCTSKQSVSQCVKPPPPPAWILTSPRLADTMNGIVSPSERRLITMQKQLEGTRSILMSVWSRFAISMGNSSGVWQYALPAGNADNSQTSVYDRLLVSVSLVPAPCKFWLHRQFFLAAQFQKRRNDGWWFRWCYCCRFVLNSKRLLSTSCNKQGQRGE